MPNFIQMIRAGVALLVLIYATSTGCNAIAPEPADESELLGRVADEVLHLNKKIGNSIKRIQISRSRDATLFVELQITLMPSDHFRELIVDIGYEISNEGPHGFEHRLSPDWFAMDNPDGKSIRIYSIKGDRLVWLYIGVDTEEGFTVLIESVRHIDHLPSFVRKLTGEDLLWEAPGKEEKHSEGGKGGKGGKEDGKSSRNL